MKTLIKTSGGIGIAVLGLVVVWASLGQTVPRPVLTIAPTGTNQFLITITNAESTVNYELYRTPVLGDPVNYPFTLHIIGAQGQSNFTVNMGSEPSGFVRAAIGSDWDGDGIENYRDADPFDPNVGELQVIIYSPANGSTINN